MKQRLGVLSATWTLALLVLQVYATAQAHGDQPDDFRTQSANVRAFGAKGDGKSDDTKALRDAVASVYRNSGSHGYVYVPAGTYRISDTLELFDTEHQRGTDYGCLRGDGAGTQLVWVGPPDKAAVRIVGGFQCIRDLTIVADSDWLTAIAYDGDRSLGRTTSGSIERVYINCQKHKGDGIQLGKRSYQADMLAIWHPYIAYCTQGAAVSTWDPNVASINLYSVTFAHNHIGVHKGTTTNLNIFGGEIDNEDVNFLISGGGETVISGVRSEGSKRVYFDQVGRYSVPVTFIGYWQAHATVTREPARGSIEKGSKELTLSNASMVEGDWIMIPGAGRVNTNMKTKVTGYHDERHLVVSDAALMSVVDVPIVLAWSGCTASTRAGSTEVALTAPCAPDGWLHVGDWVTLLDCRSGDHTRCTAKFPAPTTANALELYPVQTRYGQHLWEENSLGPYVHMNMFVQPQVNMTVSAGVGLQTFIGNVWQADIPNPFGLLTPGAGVSAMVGNSTWIDNYRNLKERMSNHFQEMAPKQLASGDTTPNILDSSFVVTGNATPTTITNFSNGFAFQTLRILVGDANTSFANGSTLQTTSGKTIQAQEGAIYTFTNVNGVWHQNQ
jgi:hypothetical protein